MKKLRVAVLAGGWSAERAISLVTGREVFKGFRDLGWKVKFIDLKRGNLAGLIQSLKQWKTEVVFPCLHGPGGEDGCIQGLLELAGIPYGGSGVQASSLAMDKVVSKRLLSQAGLPTPTWRLVDKKQFGIRIAECGRSLPLPCVVKPPSQGSSVGITIVKKRAQSAAALKLAWSYEPVALVENYVKGREFTAGILGEEALPVVEIVAKNDFYDWQSKYEEGGSRHLCPAPVPSSLEKKIKSLALQAHRLLGCKGWSRVDMMLDAKRKLWILEVNTLPGMTPTSLLPDAARAAGINFGQLLQRMLEASLIRG